MLSPQSSNSTMLVPKISKVYFQVLLGKFP